MRDIAMGVIEAGVPLLAEKPLAFELAQAHKMLDAAERRGLFFAINFNDRYAEPARRARAATRQVWEAGYFNDRDRDFHQTFDKHVEALLRALRAGEPLPVHARAGRRALELAGAIITSFEKGERVRVEGRQ